MRPTPLRPGVLFSLLLAAALGQAAGVAPPFNPLSTAATPCGTGTAPPGHQAPEIWASSRGLTLTVRQDHDRLCYTINGSAEAPIIRTRLGEDLVITLRNEINSPEAIDAVTGPGKFSIATTRVPTSANFMPVIPGMKHHATGATNLHLHGFAVPPVAPADDVLTVCTDPAVGVGHCGRRAFTYHFKIAAAMTEGLYWYHPHIHGEVQAQMLMGLTGAIVVEGPQDDRRRAAGIDERVLIVRQTQDLDAGKTQAFAMTAAPPDGPPAKKAAAGAHSDAIDTAHELLCGSSSSIDALSLNGAPIPVGEAPDAALTGLEVPAGRKQLWRILNAATDAFLDLAILDESGKPLPLEVVARDASPLADDSGTPAPVQATRASQFVPPSGRLEILVDAPPPGTKAYLVTHAVDTGCAGDRLPERRLAVINAAAGPAPATNAPVTQLARRTLFSGLLSRPTDHKRVIALAEYPRPGLTDQVDFYIAERKPGGMLSTYHRGQAPAITVSAGSTEEWTVENWTNELHAFHIHQVHFRVLSVDGQPVVDSPLLDVVNVPYAEATGYHSKEGPIRPGRVRIKLYFPESLAGDIPFHCHLVDHEDNGMMAVLRVLARKTVSAQSIR